MCVRIVSYCRHNVGVFNDYADIWEIIYFGKSKILTKKVAKHV